MERLETCPWRDAIPHKIWQRNKRQFCHSCIGHSFKESKCLIKVVASEKRHLKKLSANLTFDILTLLARAPTLKSELRWFCAELADARRREPGLSLIPFVGQKTHATRSTNSCIAHRMSGKVWAVSTFSDCVHASAWYGNVWHMFLHAYTVPSAHLYMSIVLLTCEDASSGSRQAWSLPVYPMRTSLHGIRLAWQC